MKQEVWVMVRWQGAPREGRREVVASALTSHQTVNLEVCRSSLFDSFLVVSTSRQHGFWTDAFLKEGGGGALAPGSQPLLQNKVTSASSVSEGS